MHADETHAALPSGTTARLMLAVAAGLMAGEARAGETFLDIPDVEVSYYEVSGKNAEAIRAAIDRDRPTDPNDRKRVDALASSRFEWKWRSAPKSPCETVSANVTVQLKVRLPRLTNLEQLPASLRARWIRYLDGLKAHEAQHLRNAYARRDEIAAAITGVPCKAADEAAAAIMKQVLDADIALDKRTDHGRKQGFRFP